MKKLLDMECWYKDDKNKLQKAYYQGSNDSGTKYVVKVPHLHNKLIQVDWKDLVFKEQS